MVSEAIGSLRDEEPFEGAIGLLVSYYDKSEDSSIRRIIREFLNDFKDQSVRVEVVAEIRKKWKPNTLSMLVASCWQSGLDYSDYSTEIAKLFLKSDYMTALECFTVIEESVHHISHAKKNEIVKITMEGFPSPGEEKASLVQELISILNR